MPSRDEFWMRRALNLAAKGTGLTSPNPCVGAVIVRGGKILGEGFHAKAGGPHAEVTAVRSALRAGHSLKKSTLYVTLEPCSTHGRTPPCTDLMLKHGFKRVVVAATDPNPAHAGRAFNLLRAAGIEVTSGILEKEASDLNRAFNHWIVTRQPWVVLKLALSLDGYLKRLPGESQWLTGPLARKDAQLIRLHSDAILVGAETIRADNPRLNVRGHRVRQQPLRIVVTRSGQLPKNARVFNDAHRDRTRIFRNQSWSKIFRSLGREEVRQVMVEGGAAIADDLIRKKQVHELILYFAPFAVSPDLSRQKSLPRFKNLPKLKLKHPDLQQIGPDLKLSGLL